MRILTWIVVLFLFTTACTIDKTDYESESNITNPEHNEFKEVVSIQKDNYTISLEALNGHLYKGYNEVRLKITDVTTKQVVENAKVTFLPIYTTTEGKIESCPNQYDMVYDKGEKVYKGFSVFTQENTQGDWKVEITFKDKNQSVTASQLVFVEKQNNKNLNMTSFRGIDNEDYIIALVAPIKPKVAENELVAGIYKLNAENSSLKDAYTVVDNYTLLLDPRMPEPSMGNHSSPNNKDLVQREDKFYYGVVNYTMTGNWTLNFIMLNQHGRILKGTTVPSDFTPGVEGKKSELHIDTLF
ncbi:hypothetical protein HX057_15160 [Myroides odoratimimus]|uniref:hypothetical protein n=1 Tax=Myroides odoratimimus TaxID=76832 RepID=UPI0002460761|nr:hypothetical protein [Myroides odoratimimus]EHO09297.1 hypothetical protein HMPREF9714_01975 [Myroides odoratimimus CCUG 12901]MDM1097766.1 hypothetical protein [Myroides odoratimimus]MDM1411621.1 hypothetical protein [Myroides odoratimimus]MDM1415117.1 hypothetical protein [Myroides odoratimimus]MDM1448080.1 hypothetical protein [Myroides odoratimimus]